MRGSILPQYLVIMILAVVILIVLMAIFSPYPGQVVQWASNLLDSTSGISPG